MMKLTLNVIIKNLFLFACLLFSISTFAKLPDLYKVLELIDSSNKSEINPDSPQKNVNQNIRVLLANNNLEQIVVQKSQDGFITVTHKGEQIAEALFGKSVPNPYLIVESVKNGMQLLLDPIRRDQYNKMRIASNPEADFNSRLQAIDSLPSLDLQIKMGLSLSNEDAKRGQRLTSEAEQWLIKLIQKEAANDYILGMAAIRALQNASPYSDTVKNELLKIVKKERGSVSPRLREASAETLKFFNLEPVDINILSKIVKDTQEQAIFRATVFHAIEIKSPIEKARALYRWVTGGNLEDVYLLESSAPRSPPPINKGPPRTMQLEMAAGYGGQPGRTYTTGRDPYWIEEESRSRSELQVRQFKEALINARSSSGSSRCSGGF